MEESYLSPLLAKSRASAMPTRRSRKAVRSETVPPPCQTREGVCGFRWTSHVPVILGLSFFACEKVQAVIVLIIEITMIGV